MELYYWPGQAKYGLPSIDIHSLHLLSYIKFSKAPVTLCPSYKSFLSKGSTLPCLYTGGGEEYKSTKDILNFFTHKYFDPDVWMDLNVKEKVLPMKALIDDKLLPAVLGCLWLDTANYTEFTRALFAKQCRYPLNFSTPQRIHKEVEDYVRQTKHFYDEDLETICSKLHEDAVFTINLFSEFLADKTYLLGNKPSSLDALLFPCLCMLLKLPLVSSKLQSHLQACTNLRQYTCRILESHFKDDVKKSDFSITGAESEEKYEWALTVGVAAVAMVSYALNSGIITLRR